MNYSDFRFTLDIQIHQAQVSVPVTFGDSARRLCIGLTDGRKSYVIGEGCRAVFNAKKPDGKVIKNDCIIERNVIIYEFTEQTANAEGIVYCDITIYDAYGKVLTSPQFIIVVDKRVVRDEEVAVSADQYTTIDNMITQETWRQLNEERRKSQEDQRRAAEFGDAHNYYDEEYGCVVDSNRKPVAYEDGGRVGAELQREINESQRNSNETERGEAETLRENAETIRIEKEIERQLAEEARNIAEQTRDQYEWTRMNNEGARELAEETRIGNETLRVAKDAERDGKIAKIEALVGDVDTALDSIIAFQESFIGGDA